MAQLLRIMAIKRTILSLLICVCGSVLYAAPTLPGKWRGKLNGQFDISMKLIMDATQLSGIVYTPLGENIVFGGKIKGNEFTFLVDSDNVQSVYKGKVDGDKMSVKINSQWGEMNGELTRMEPNTPLNMSMKPQHTEFWEPEPPTVAPGPYVADNGVPSDATVLFGGQDLNAWQTVDGGSAKWEVANNTFTVKKGTGDIQTRQSFGDYQLHIEWQVPSDIDGEGQARGNSGIFMQGIYELQVLDSYNNKTYVNGQAGSIYKQAAPLVNATRKPGELNVYDILYTAPRFNENGVLAYPARITVFHNGIVIQNNLQIKGDTPYVGLPKYTSHGKGPIRLQDHGDPSKPISFRNIWIREL